MKNLPISLKLFIGFGAVLTLLLISGGTAFYYLSGNLESFTSYRDLARDTNLMGRVQANLLMVRMNVKDYLITDSQKDVAEYHSYMKVADGFIHEALKNIKNPERERMIRSSNTKIDDYDTEFGRVRAFQAERNAEVQIMDSKGPIIEKKLSELMRAASDSGDTLIAYHAGQVLRNLLLGRLYAAKFLRDNKQASVDRVHSEFVEFMEGYEALEQELSDFQQRQLLAEVKELKTEYLAAFDLAVKHILQRNEVVVKRLDVLGAQIAKNMEDIKLSVKNEQDILGPKVQRESEQAKMLVGVLSSIAVFIGLFAGIIISRAISRPLAEATAFATAVSKGDFSKSIKIDQKDEVGKICEALDSIKDAVAKAADEVEGIVVRMEKGDLKANGDASRFSGGFANLVDGVNTLVATYSNFLNQLPVGILSLTRDHKVAYLNTVAQTISGVSSFEGKVCSDLFNTTDCNSERCASDICMKRKSAASSETKSETSQGSYEISYTSIPLIDRAGQVNGAIEIMIDQTEIKTAQKTMLEVAERANDIADRVASSSEELSAQVEQVSQGAEVQQQRVGETATAMEEMNATVLEVAQNASRASEQSENARDKADEGAALVNRVVTSINGINDVARELQGNMEKLGQHADSIGSVMTVITDIADQTNLLALNAAIEAARAGEAGRGFAVVADEVRKLAEKTMAATTEVGENIRTIQSAAESNIQSVNRAVENVNEATGLANDSGTALSQIVTMSSGTSELISGIATAAEQQSATSEQITNAIDEVNRIVAETTDGMVQSSHAVHDLAQMASDLKNVLAGLSSGKMKG